MSDLVESFEGVGDDTQSVELDPDAAREIACWAPLEGSGVDEIVEDECIDTSGRWEDRYRIVIKDEEGRYWESYYSSGSTEQQPVNPYEYKDAAKFTRVYKEEIIEEKFLTKGEKSSYTPVETTALKKEED